LQLAGQREAIWDEHEAIVKAIAAGDVKQAAELSGTHAHIARENLFAHLGEAVSLSQSKHKARGALRTS
jgi:DNA-binding GntR family transcriptional regulator